MQPLLKLISSILLLSLFVATNGATQASENDKTQKRIEEPIAEVSSLKDQMYEARILGDYTQAIEIGMRIISIEENVLGLKNPKIVNSLTQLAWIYSALEDYPKAALLYERALSIQETALQHDQSETDLIFHELREIYAQEGDNIKFQKLSERIQAIKEKTFRSENGDSIRNLSELASYHMSQFDIANAEMVFMELDSIYEKDYGPNHPYTAENLNKRAELYVGEYKYAKAEPLLQRVLSIREAALGPDHLDTTQSLDDLGTNYYHLDKYTQAETLLLRALRNREAALPTDHPEIVRIVLKISNLYNAQKVDTKAEEFAERYEAITSSLLDKRSEGVNLNNRFIDLYDTGNYTEAEKIAAKALSINETYQVAFSRIETTKSLANYALIHSVKDDYNAAEKLYERALSLLDELHFGRDRTITAKVLSEYGDLLISKGDYTKALQLIQRSIDIREYWIGPEHIHTADSLFKLAKLYDKLGNFAKAELIYQRVLSIRRKNLPSDHHKIASVLFRLANLYETLGNYSQAESLFQNSLSIYEKSDGTQHPNIAGILNNLASLYELQGDYEKAKPFRERALSISEKAFGVGHLDTVSSLNKRASSYFSQANYTKAESLYQRALSIRENDLGTNNPKVALSLNNLAGVYEAQKDYIYAESLYERALSIREKIFGPDNPKVALSLNNLATLYEVQGDYVTAKPLYERALSIREKAYGFDHPNVAKSLNSLAKLHRKFGDEEISHNYAMRAAQIFKERAIRAAGGNLADQINSDNEISYRKNYFYDHIIIASHLSSSEPKMSRELMSNAYSSGQFALQTSAGAALEKAAARFSSSNNRVARIVKERQNLTEEWEALKESLSFSIGKNNEGRDSKKENEWRNRMASIDLKIIKIDKILEKKFPEYFALVSPRPLDLADTQKLLYENEALLMFLAGTEGTIVFAISKEKTDWALVEDMDQETLNEAVRVLRISLENPQNPFPRGQAYSLYKKLIGAIEEVVSNKDHVFLVPSGALGSIPLGVLVTEPPQGSDASPNALRSTHWWGTKKALTTLPSASSLKALRLLAKDGRGREPFAGFGNPILDGPKADNNNNRSTNLASRGTAAYFRGQFGDVEAIRSMAPLPETETELISLAKAMGAKSNKSLWLDSRATEANLKKADLSEKRVLAFATHGLMSGEMSGLSEPALVFTPPYEATDEDDGLLTASEAALLNLNADWVILSACNTAAADEPGADGLSGLARSFFYAGARAILVSHWPVRDDAAARLTTTAISMQDLDPTLGRAEALRRSMLVLLHDEADPTLAHPSAWAPFVVVGEGGSIVPIDKSSFDPATYTPPEPTSEKSSFNIVWLIGGLGMIIFAFVGFFGFRSKNFIKPKLPLS